MKVNGPCIDCGTWDELQVDHVDARLKVEHRVWSWSAERRSAELAKCVARCDPCHRKKSVVAGDTARGEINGAAKLTAEDVLMVRASSLSLRALAVQLDVDYSLIWQIRARKIWKHI